MFRMAGSPPGQPYSSHRLDQQGDEVEQEQPLQGASESSPLLAGDPYEI
jgi:hypothetical protein